MQPEESPAWLPAYLVRLLLVQLAASCHIHMWGKNERSSAVEYCSVGRLVPVRQPVDRQPVFRKRSRIVLALDWEYHSEGKDSCSYSFSWI